MPSHLTHIDQFDFDLPDSYIARYPLAQRSASRLIQLDKKNQRIWHTQFTRLPLLLEPNDLLVFNDTKVIPARLYARKMPDGGKVELLIERVLDDHVALAHLKSNRPMKLNTVLTLVPELTCDAGVETGFKVSKSSEVDRSQFEVTATVVAREGDGLFKLNFSPQTQSVIEVLKTIGHVPLPPYLQRPAVEKDSMRYQTVYAKHEGAVAAPTAGLHFDQPLLQALVKRKVNMAYITLHVGAGTFQPVRTDNIHQHTMHSELIDVSPETCEAIRATRRLKGRVIAVGTTVVRALETAAQNSSISGLKPFKGQTCLFIYPGYTFKVIGGMITNFHQPKSTLLMLVCAFAGYEFTMTAYQEAIREKYRFYSYGDAMLIH